MNRQKILSRFYWATTLLFSAALAWSAVQYLIEAPRMQATMLDHLGYPAYFPKILAVFKLAGVVALLAPLTTLLPFGRELKEWAYAGFTFDLLGACASHASVGDSLPTVAVPLAFLVMLAASYWLWKRSHGVLFSTQTSPNGPARTHAFATR
jgi:DoxX-like family